MIPRLDFAPQETEIGTPQAQARSMWIPCWVCPHLSNFLDLFPARSGFIAAVERDRETTASPVRSILLVGDPRRMDDLHPLAGADEEIRKLNDIYRGFDRSVLVHEHATSAGVLAQLPTSDIVHMAVHATVDRKDPSRSRIHLAAKDDLSMSQILQMRLTRPRLVVLAACDTQAGPLSASEGVLSLSGSFLAAGVPAVIGSLWPVDDRRTVDLFIRFHQELRRGADAMSALRTAQLAELRGKAGDRDWTWASFELFGGVEAKRPLENPDYD